MSAAPSHEVRTIDTEAEVADIRRLVHAQTVWVPRGLAAGNMHPMTALKAVAGLSRRDNDTKELTWRSSDINARCGTTSAKNGMNVLSDLAEAGVVNSYWQRRAGAPYTVEFATIESTKHLEVPQAALWKHKWVHGNIVGPRYGKDTAHVLRWILAILAASDFTPGNLKVEHAQGAADICKRSGLDRDAYDRAWAVVRRVCNDDPWITWEGTFWEDGGGQGPNVITIDWTRLPALTAPPPKKTRTLRKKVNLIKQTPVLSTGRGVAAPAGRGGASGTPRGAHSFREPVKEASSFHQSSLSHTSSSQLREQPETQAANETAEEDMETAATVEDLPMLDAIRKGRKSQHAGDGGMDNTTTDYDSWLLAVVAIMADASTPNRLGLSRPDGQLLHGLLEAPYKAGWKAGNLGAALTRDEPPQSVSAVLPGRVRRLPEQANYVPEPVNRKALAEKAAYDLAASARSADKYTQTHM